MQQKRSAIRSAPLTAMTLAREPDRVSCQRKIASETEVCARI